MVKFLLAAHLVLVVFAIGPLVHAATTASRGIRRGDGVATASAARMLRIYTYASALVVIVGVGLMSQKRHGEKIADFADTWIWLSVVLWMLAAGVVLGVLVPTLTKVTTQIEAENSVVAQTGRAAAAGGVVALIFLVIVVLMVYQPGS